jgi:hypothetical protein
MHVEKITENGKEFLIIKLPLQSPTPSSTGKSLIVATSGGIQVTPVIINGKPVNVGVNAFIKS